MLKNPNELTGYRLSKITAHLADGLTIFDNVLMIRWHGVWYGKSGAEPNQFNSWKEFKENEMNIIDSAEQYFDTYTDKHKI